MIRKLMIRTGIGLCFIFFLLLLPAMHTVLKGKVHTGDDRAIRRIVSLSPSITDQVNDLGAAHMLCGVTPYNPEYRGDAEIIGNYISPDIEKLMSLNPDIVLLSDEDSAQSFVVHGKSGLRYYRFGRVGNFDDICSNYMVLADMLGRTSAAANIKIYRERLSRVSRPEHEPGVIFLVSVKPLITVSGSSYISSIIRQAGGRNLFENGRTPYPILNMEALLLADPDAVIVMIHDDREYLEKYLERFKNVRFVKKKNIYSTGDGSIPYYSPERYVESVEIFAGIFAGLNE